MIRISSESAEMSPTTPMQAAEKARFPSRAFDRLAAAERIGPKIQLAGDGPKAAARAKQLVKLEIDF
jgi:hypothetical protein